MALSWKRRLAHTGFLPLKAIFIIDKTYVLLMTRQLLIKIYLGMYKTR